MAPASIGRIVHYQAHGSPDGTHKPAPRAAVITGVNPDVIAGDDIRSDVSLCVLNPSGMFFNEHCLFDDSETPRGGTWHWPPKV